MPSGSIQVPTNKFSLRYYGSHKATVTFSVHAMTLSLRLKWRWRAKITNEKHWKGNASVRMHMAFLLFILILISGLISHNFQKKTVNMSFEIDVSASSFDWLKQFYYVHQFENILFHKCQAMISHSYLTCL